MAAVVTSAKHPQLQRVRRLSRRRTRDAAREFVAEGEDLVRAGLDAGVAAELIVVDASRHLDVADVVARASCDVLLVEHGVLAGTSALGHPPRVIAVFARPEHEPGDVLAAAAARGPVIALDALADPGNVGTVVRSVAALGGAGVLLLPETADPWSPKAVRASMGACFRVPVAQAEHEQLAGAATVVALDPRGDVDLADAPLDGGTVVVVGSERHGISPGGERAATVRVRIPQDESIDSINAAVAASLVLYEWRRRG